MQFELKRHPARGWYHLHVVTHDQEEALTMSDRIVLMNHGVIEQIGTPFEVYRAPETRFVSSFVGEANFFEGKVRESQRRGDLWETVLDTAGGAVVALTPQQISQGSDAWVSIRPETMRIERLSGGASGDSNSVVGEVEGAVFLGPSIRYLVAPERAAGARPDRRALGPCLRTRRSGSGQLVS